MDSNVPSDLILMKTTDAEYAGQTVHVVGRLTPEVLSFLQPALSTIKLTGATQTLIVIGDEYGRGYLEKLAAYATIILAPDAKSPLRRTLILYQKLEEVQIQAPINALHLHGISPGLAGAMLMQTRKSRHPIDVFISPHSSRALVGRNVLRPALLLLLKYLFRETRQQSIVNISSDAKLVSQISDSPVEVLESAVADSFFRIHRREAKRPLLLGGGRNETPEAAQRFAQLAVLLGAEELGLAYNWVGTLTLNGQAQFKAAGVSSFPASNEEERSNRLATAWIYVAPGDDRGFPIALAEAMAAGVPCVALDTAINRNILNDGAAGFLCTNYEVMMQCIARLIDSPELRSEYSTKGRQTALARFSEKNFRETLLKIYQNHNSTTLKSPPNATTQTL